MAKIVDPRIYSSRLYRSLLLMLIFLVRADIVKIIEEEKRRACRGAVPATIFKFCMKVYTLGCSLNAQSV